jgi:hypothetical protein
MVDSESYATSSGTGSSSLALRSGAEARNGDVLAVDLVNVTQL